MISDRTEALMCPSEQASAHELIGSSSVMADLHSFISKVAPTKATVLVYGETGTGKELVARCLHRLSGHGAQLVAVNCSALPDTLLGSELFGHERGAFTGAIERRIGLLESADGGTVFLDEVASMSLEVQAKLLRFLQEKTIQRVGGNEVLTLDVRVIAASNVDLDSLVSKGKFRQDLFYRLQGLTLTVPPLRDRREDILLLAAHFLRIYSSQNSKSVRGFAKKAQGALLQQDWFGNVRELELSVERAVILAEGDVAGLSDLGLSPADDIPTRDGTRCDLESEIEALKEERIVEALAESDGDIEAASATLGITTSQGTSIQMRSQRRKVLGAAGDHFEQLRQRSAQASSNAAIPAATRSTMIFLRAQLREVCLDDAVSRPEIENLFGISKRDALKVLKANDLVCQGSGPAACWHFP